MKEAKEQIPFFKEINDFLEAIPSSYRTSNPIFYCLRITQNASAISNYMPPFKKGFYFMALVTDAGDTKITYDNIDEKKLDSFLVFQSPGHLYSFHRDNSAHGFLVYFKVECFSFFRPDFEKEFPFFNIFHTNFFKFHQAKFKEFAPLFEDVFSAYENVKNNQYHVPVMKLLALLYQLKEFTLAFNQWEQGFSTPQQLLLKKYVQLVNNFYLEKRAVEEYAELLSVTPNHLSQSIKLASDKNALSFINDRIMTEAKTLIRYTTKDIAEIAHQLNFSDPANFGRFFKKHSDFTPVEFRKMKE